MLMRNKLHAKREWHIDRGLSYLEYELRSHGNC